MSHSELHSDYTSLDRVEFEENKKVEEDIIEKDRTQRSTTIYREEIKDPQCKLRGKLVYYQSKIKKPKLTLNGKYLDEYYNADIGTGCERYYRGERVKYTTSTVENFVHIVDLDDFEYHKITFHHFLAEVLQSAFFRFGILFLVLLNAVLIGLATDDNISRNYAQYFSIIDQFILTIFIFEILVKWMYDFRLFFKVNWNILDFLIVTLIICTAIVPVFGNSKALVIVRVIRAFRSLRSVSSLTSLTIVAHTVVRSALDMGNILIVLLIIMTVMSVMGVILFEGIDVPFFSTALEAWYLNFVCVTQDGWVDFIRVLDKQETYSRNLITIYIMIGVSIGGFVFSNLIIAVVVANLELSVSELKLEKQMEENPLENKEQFLVDELEVLPVYELLVQNNVPLRVQRPMKLPTFAKISERRLIAYLMILVALEHNMLEASYLHDDLEKVMNVEINIVKQMQKLTPERVEIERGLGAKVLNDFNALGALGNEDVVLQRMTLLDELNKLNKNLKAGKPDFD